ncbi:MAG: hypothetical protein V3S11_02340 [Elusimicrobiota bacterium]
MKPVAGPRRRTIAPLDVVEFPAGPDDPTIICMHGYGADASDLASFGEQIRLKVPARWIFPEAPFPMAPMGRMWFPVPEEQLERLQMGGESLDLSQERPEGMDQSLDMLEDFIKNLGVPWPDLILGGFSQGSMLAVELAMRASEPPQGVFILSGNLVDEKAMHERAPRRKGLRFFQSHGRQDPLLGFQGAKRLEKVLQECGWEGRLIDFEGAHGVPLEILPALGEFIDSL